MAIEGVTVSTVGTGESQTESSAGSEINQMNYILRDMTFNAVDKFEKLNSLPDNIFSAQEKQSLADQLSQHFGIRGLTVNVQV